MIVTDVAAECRPSPRVASFSTMLPQAVEPPVGNGIRRGAGTMLKMATALLMILGASFAYLHTAQPGGLCAVIDHPYLCHGGTSYGMDAPELAAAD